MSKYLTLIGLVVIGSWWGYGCRHSDPFVGDWIKVANWDGSDLQKEEPPVEMRITTEGIFYHVEVTNFGDTDGKFEPYPEMAGGESTKGKYQSDGAILSSLSDPGWTITYKEDNDTLFESAWLGYFKRK
jgi:hypothetical protein